MLHGSPDPSADEARIRALADYDIIDVPPLPDLPSVVELAAYLCGVPKAVVNIISATRQHQIAAVGFEPGPCAREDSMCAVSITEPAPVMVPDARLDRRFQANPWVTGEVGTTRFYAASQLRTPGGEVLGTLCVFDDEPRELTPAQRDGLDKLARMVMDVLELHRHARLLDRALHDVRRTSTELQRSNRALRHFSAQVSHDLKNPLTGILGFVASLGDIPTVSADDDARLCVDRALSSATRMWRMIEDVLAHASVGGRSDFTPVELDDIARQVLDDLVVPVRTAGAEILVGSLPTVVGDGTQLRILLQNLVGNAVKFRHPERPPLVIVDGADEPHSWTVRVADNGVGIAPGDRARVLEIFERIRTDVDGHGIGLATCQRIIAAHDGSLTIEDTPGGGTTFTVSIPRPPGLTAAGSIRASAGAR